MQRRFQNYLSDIRSKGASEVFGYTVGIGATFGFDSISFDGSNLLVTSDVSKNFRHNLTSERGILTGAKSGVVTPDGILTIETGDILIPMTTGISANGREIMVIASHIWDDVEGGLSTLYRVITNPVEGTIWLPTLQNSSATIETWYNLVGSQISRVNEVIVAYALITSTGSDYYTSNIKNPYNYKYTGDSEYVLREVFDSEMDNLKQLIPTLKTYDLAFTDLEYSVYNRVTLNGASTKLAATVEMNNPDQSYITKFGSVLDILISGVIKPSQNVDFSQQIVAAIEATLNYTSPKTIRGKFVVPINSKWLTSVSNDPDIGERLWYNTHSCYGFVTIEENRISMTLEMPPVNGGADKVGIIDVSLQPAIEFFGKIPLMEQLEDSFVITLQSRSLSGTTGQGSVMGGGRYNTGDGVTVLATPAQGSGFVAWYEGNDVVSSSPSYVFVVNKSRILTAVFNGSSTKVSITATVDPSGKGTFTGTGEYTMGATASVKCTPATGYTFKQAEMDGVIYTTNPISFNVTKSVNVNFILTAPTRTLTIHVWPTKDTSGNNINVIGWQNTGGGSLANPSQQTPGKIISVGVIMIDTTNWEFDGWFIGGPNGVITGGSGVQRVTSNALVNYTMPDMDVHLYAVAKAKSSTAPTEYYLDITVVGNGIVFKGLEIGTDPSGWYAKGTDILLSAEPSSGANFIGWDGDIGSNSATNPSITITMNQDRNIRATFSSTASTFVLTMGMGSGGSVVPSIGRHTYNRGDFVTLTATPSTGYKFKGWYGLNGQSDADVQNPKLASTYVSMIRDVYAMAQFERVQGQTYTVSVVNSPVGAGSISGAGTYAEGAQVSLFATPFNGYKFREWLRGSNSLSTNQQYIFNINNNISLIAAYDTVIPTNNITFGFDISVMMGSEPYQFVWPLGADVRVIVTLQTGSSIVRTLYDQQLSPPATIYSSVKVTQTVDIGSFTGLLNIRLYTGPYKFSAWASYISPQTQITASTGGIYVGVDSQEGKNYQWSVPATKSATLYAQMGWLDPGFRPS